MNEDNDLDVCMNCGGEHPTEMLSYSGCPSCITIPDDVCDFIPSDEDRAKWEAA